MHCVVGRAVASGEASGAQPPHLKSVPPISRLTHRLLHTSNTVFKKCGPPFWFLVPPSGFWPPLLLNPGDGPGGWSEKILIGVARLAVFRSNLRIFFLLAVFVNMFIF